MSKMILEKNAAHRKFVSPSASSDLSSPSATSSLPQIGFNAKTGIGLLVGVWALRKFPTMTVLGALAFGVYKGLQSQKTAGGKNPFQGEGIVKDFMH